MCMHPGSPLIGSITDRREVIYETMVIQPKTAAWLLYHTDEAAILERKNV